MGNSMALDQVAQIEEMESAQISEVEISEVAAVVVAPAVVLMGEVEVKRWHGEPTSRVFGWQRMPVRDALRLQDDTFRCPECLGRVRLRAASAEKNTAPHAEHYSKNTGCSLGNCFSGEKQLHIKPLN
jgi:hypothetical protein